MLKMERIYEDTLVFSTIKNDVEGNITKLVEGLNKNLGYVKEAEIEILNYLLGTSLETGDLIKIWALNNAQFEVEAEIRNEEIIKVKDFINENLCTIRKDIKLTFYPNVNFKEEYNSKEELKEDVLNNFPSDLINEVTLFHIDRIDSDKPIKMEVESNLGSEIRLVAVTQSYMEFDEYGDFVDEEVEERERILFLFDIFHDEDNPIVDSFNIRSFLLVRDGNVSVEY